MNGADVYLAGVGSVGGALLDLLGRLWREELSAEGRASTKCAQVPADVPTPLRLAGIASSRAVFVVPHGTDLDPGMARTTLREAGEPGDLGRFLALARSSPSRARVLVDCTNAEPVARTYPSFLEAGFHVVTASKLANASALVHYRAIRDAARAGGTRFLYETNVGAALPLISTLRALLEAGDTLISCEGVLSGSLSALCGALERGVPLSKAVREAKERGYTEPDPRDDLSGLDVARKALILARESGAALELADVDRRPFLEGDGGEDLVVLSHCRGESVEDFLAGLERHDAAVAARVAKARSVGTVLRYVARVEGGVCRVGLEALDEDHPFAAVRDAENAASITTFRHSPAPLVVRGYGAGGETTAAGVYADIVRALEGSGAPRVTPSRRPTP